VRGDKGRRIYMTWRGYFFLHAREPPVGQGLFIVEALQLHSGTTNSLGILWRSDQPYLTKHKTHNRHPSIRDGIRTRNPGKRTAADPSFRPRATARLTEILFLQHICQEASHVCISPHYVGLLQSFL
jgi:hypothetical protein